MPPVRVQTPLQLTQATCPACHSLYTPRRPTQRFCKDACRAAYHRDHGHTARVVSVRVLKGGKVSVVLHSDALGGLEPGQEVMIGGSGR